MEIDSVDKGKGKRKAKSKGGQRQHDGLLELRQMRQQFTVQLLYLVSAKCTNARSSTTVNVHNHDH